MPASTGAPAIGPQAEIAPVSKPPSRAPTAPLPGAHGSLQHQIHRSKDGSVVLYIEPTEKSIKFLELLIPVLRHEVGEEKD
jgi:hypothetical protein